MKYEMPREATVYVLLNRYTNVNVMDCQIIHGKARFVKGTEYDIEFPLQHMDIYSLIHEQMTYVRSVKFEAIAHHFLWIEAKDKVLTDAYISLDKAEILQLIGDGINVQDHTNRVYSELMQPFLIDYGDDHHYGQDTWRIGTWQPVEISPTPYAPYIPRQNTGGSSGQYLTYVSDQSSGDPYLHYSLQAIDMNNIRGNAHDHTLRIDDLPSHNHNMNNYDFSNAMLITSDGREYPLDLPTQPISISAEPEDNERGHDIRGSAGISGSAEFRVNPDGFAQLQGYSITGTIDTTNRNGWELRPNRIGSGITADTIRNP